MLAPSIRRMAGVVALLCAVALLQSASAHAQLASADPAPDSTIRAAPARLTARFTQEIDPDVSKLSVTAPDGTAADLGDGKADLSDPDRQSMTATLRPNLPPGVYIVSWTTKSSEDQDTVSGSYTFTIDPNAPATPVTASPTPSPTVVATLPAVSAAPTSVVADSGSGDSGGFSVSRGALIVGGVAIVVAIVVVASVGARGRR